MPNNKDNLPRQSYLSAKIAQAVFDILVKYKFLRNKYYEHKLFMSIQCDSKNICTRYVLSHYTHDRFYNANRQFYIENDGVKTPHESTNDANKELAIIYQQHCAEIAAS
ncbi:MAG: hypothetical protein ACI9TY_000074 [Alphaproteobacteria bacterium]|jgi:hypothetical protein